MKSTGIVRRIDDLGRVVIPREIRRTLRIREGDPLELFTTENGGICFVPYVATHNAILKRLELLVKTLNTQGIEVAIYYKECWAGGASLINESHTISDLTAHKVSCRQISNTDYFFAWEFDKEIDWTRIDYARIDMAIAFAHAIIMEEEGGEG
jgi:AbrB family looped-hinge helix DNA binding protein